MKMLLKLFSLLVLLCLSGCGTSPVASLGISSDGQYVITAHEQGELVLWDVAKKSKKLLAEDANINSAYFIPDSHEFMWQDKNNIVHIQDVMGRELKQFPHFETEGHQMTADKSFYLSADTTGELYKSYGDKLTPIYTDTPISGLQPYSLSIWGNYILSASHTTSGRKSPPAETNLTVNPVNPDKYKRSSYDGVTLWDKTTLKPIARLWGDQGPTVGTISPDGKWIVTGSTHQLKWIRKINELDNRIGLESAYGIYNEKTMEYEVNKLPPIPTKLQGKKFTKIFEVSAIAFVTDKDFILFQPRPENELAALYTTGEPLVPGYALVQGYVDIGKGVSVRNLSIASAPKVHIVATGQYKKGGINVYRYHPESKELEKIWEAD